MTLSTGSGSLPHHQYVHVDRSAIRDGVGGFEPAVWFGLHAHPGRAWGCHLMLECGAVYRNVPPHQIAFTAEPEPEWGVTDAQLWDCYGQEFSLLRYDYLSSLDGVAKVRGREVPVSYLFTAVPLGDAFSEAPDQSKEFMFLRTDGGRLTIQPTNRVLFIDRSFTTGPVWPKDLRRQTERLSCEDGR